MRLDSGYWESLGGGDRLLLAVGLGGLACLLAWIYAAPGQSWPAQPIGVVTTEGAVKRRPSRSLSWQWIHGEGTLYLKDTVFTPPDTRSVVTFDNGSQMELQPNTMVRFSDLQSHQIDVAVLRGDVEVLNSDGSGAKVKVRPRSEPSPVTPSRPLTERAARLRRIVAQRLRRLPDLDVGMIRLSEPFPDPTAIAMRLGELQRQVAGLKPPALGSLRSVKSLKARSVASQLNLYTMRTVSPAKKEKVRLRTGCVRLLWTPVPVQKVSYYLEISRDKRFRYVRSYGTRTNEIALRLNDHTRDYYWRVRAVYGSQSVVTPLTWFEVERPPESKAKARAELKTLPTWEVCDQI